MFYAYTARFDLMENFEIFLVFFIEQGLICARPRLGRNKLVVLPKSRKDFYLKSNNHKFRFSKKRTTKSLNKVYIKSNNIYDIEQIQSDSCI